MTERAADEAAVDAVLSASRSLIADEQRDIARALAAFAAAGEVPESRWPPAPLDDGRQLA